ncbi:hypothetical protein A4X03_0g5730 [Tilletia caries]|uniref:SWIM-type domain-containing protein n=1 Tax=Tilletia caries TaxID=13290 RepID=A0A8T8T245_9BASI|nr:hypothetical protein CF335_g5699 [Tilletia laevis]KAE8254380.1 hypothetical protein A4X03_0g5730 [Tilletia caries]
MSASDSDSSGSPDSDPATHSTSGSSESDPQSPPSPPVSHVIAHNQTILQATLQSLGPSLIEHKEDRPLAGIQKVRRRNKGKHIKWKLVTSSKTQHVYQWFESQRNDYSSQAMQTTSWVDVIWVGHPGNSPKDLSARAWFVQLDKNLNQQETREVTSDKDKRVVLRAFFRCAGRCAMSKPPVSADEDDSGEETESEGVKKGGRPKLPTRECEGGVRLMIRVEIEVEASDLGTAKIYSCGNHRDANEADLQYSRRLRLYMQGVGSRLGETAAKLKRELRDGTSADADTAALPRAYPFPDFRIPKAKKIDAVMKGIRSSKRLHSDPFAAVSMFVKRNPSLVFGFERLQVRKKTFRFSVGIKSKWSIRNLIRFQKHLVHIDSSWRNKNENRAPLTFVTITNHVNHMVPCAAYLSANVNAETIAIMLRALEEEVVAEAEAICNSSTDDLAEMEQKEPLLLKHALQIQAAQAWSPAGVMIDKCLAELNAIKEVWPEVQVRICQFHAIQAVCRWQTDSGISGARAKKIPAINKIDKLVICSAFREAQRCRTAEEWPEHQKKFETAVNKILKKYSSSARSAVNSYFNTNWWQSVWRDITTDIGLQEGQTRDDANTNNTIERAFKTFDEIFLSCRVNKRIDRLVHILAMDWLPYYEHYSSDVPRPNKELKDIMLHAHKLWESGTAIEERDDGLYNVWDTVEVSKSRRKSKAHHDLKVVSFTVDMDHGSLGCTCSKWKQTGKYCAHMHAVLMLQRMGTVEESMKQEAGVFSEPLPWSPERNYGKSASDSVYDAELHEALAQAEAEANVNKDGEADSAKETPAATEAPEGIHPSGGPKATSGRPPKVQPLQPSRTESSSNVRFAAKRGRPKETAEKLWEVYNKNKRQKQDPESNISVPQVQKPVEEQDSATAAIAAVVASMEQNDTVRFQLRADLPLVHLCKGDFKALLPSQWLTGTVITIWGQLVTHNIAAKQRSNKQQRVLLTSVLLFVEGLKDIGMEHRVDNFHSDEVLFSWEKLVCPLHIDQNHWAVAVVDLGKKEVTVVDSLPSSEKAERIVKFFSEFLRLRAEKEADSKKIADATPFLEGWKLAPPPGPSAQFPIQDDIHSCGVVTCRVIEAILKGKSPSWKNCMFKGRVITSQEADDFRRSLFVDIQSSIVS